MPKGLTENGHCANATPNEMPKKEITKMLIPLYFYATRQPLELWNRSDDLQSLRGGISGRQGCDFPTTSSREGLQGLTKRTIRALQISTLGERQNLRRIVASKKILLSRHLGQSMGYIILDRKESHTPSMQKCVNSSLHHAKFLILKTCP